jgi:hypothetical protein
MNSKQKVWKEGMLPFFLFVFFWVSLVVGVGACGVNVPLQEPAHDAGQQGLDSGSTEPVGVPEKEAEKGSPDGMAPDASVPEPPGPSPRTQVPWRGVVLSSPRGGQIWATDGMKQTMAEVQQLGGNWAAYHPYARINNDGSLRFSTDLDQDTVRKPMEFGRDLGMSVFLIPHIAYWGSKFSWRGEITFETEEEWQRFFSDYKTWTVTMAKMAQAGGAQLFSIGIEYKKTLHREKDWRDIIKAVREVYKGKIVYAANWDSYTNVPFWDAVDYIGVQAYFPVADKADPPESAIREGWKKVLATLKAFSETHKRPILFTELGYNRSTYAAVRPWAYEQGGENAEAVKLRCMKVALDVLKPASFLQGVFLWKWFPDGRVSDYDFILQYPEMKSVLRDAWGMP